MSYVWSKPSPNNCFPSVASADWQVLGRVGFSTFGQAQGQRHHAARACSNISSAESTRRARGASHCIVYRGCIVYSMQYTVYCT